MVLTDPRLLETELVHRLDQFEVSLERERRILPGGVKRRHEVSESHSHILDPVFWRVAGDVTVGGQMVLFGPASGDKVGHDNT